MVQPIASMTGYARSGGVAAGISFSVEIKTVNGRGLDMRLRLAPGYDALEGEIRRRIGQALSRGSVTLSLAVDRIGSSGPVLVNQRALGTVLAAMQAIGQRIETAPSRPEGILALQGVLEQHEIALSPEDEEALQGAILSAVDHVLADLVAVRKAEGAHIAEVLTSRIDEIEALVRLAEDQPGRSREALLARLRQQIEDLQAAGAGVSEDRLAQEALLLATKADVREELDRLVAHIASARLLLANGGAVGRKLDFLSQEFNREANTLCAKSGSVGLTAIGLDLKAVIDQLREQVQNIE
jgi:uncharacterized protein (TIGR00255 family)